jgi:hypothetical protein
MAHICQLEHFLLLVGTLTNSSPLFVGVDIGKRTYHEFFGSPLRACHAPWSMGIINLVHGNFSLHTSNRLGCNPVMDPLGY